ncbi:MAG: 8-oxo-dGTP diphosphatase [Patescibacteria group bacterium]|jgi:8-oxo-dGTP diphosphatase|nr:8-oxo-dGTP diphosphatase [Patescibacteria group bacterium]
MPLKPVRRQIFVALALIVNEKGEILLGKRHDPRNRGMHGKWEFPGGKVEFGEKPEDTVAREAREEVALDVVAEKVMNIYSWFHPDRPHIQVILMAYLARPTNTGVARPNCREVSEVAWVTIDQALSIDLIENNKSILNDLKKAL